MSKSSFDAFQVIADGNRRKMLLLLTKKSMTINTLAENFAISRPAVSKHVRILHEAGFIIIRDIGRERHCLLKQDGFSSLQNWLDYFGNFWACKLNKLELLFKQESTNKE
jgi:DNA-binding transcriptional ArsR family regulator